MLMNKNKEILEAAAEVMAAPQIASRSPWADARRRFLRNKAALVSLVLLTIITLACVIGPMVLPHEYDATDWDAMGFIWYR
jgi:oligopeptide transport system permease protein